MLKLYAGYCWASHEVGFASRILVYTAESMEQAKYFGKQAAFSHYPQVEGYSRHGCDFIEVPMSMIHAVKPY